MIFVHLNVILAVAQHRVIVYHASQCIIDNLIVQIVLALMDIQMYRFRFVKNAIIHVIVVLELIKIIVYNAIQINLEL